MVGAVRCKLIEESTQATGSARSRRTEWRLGRSGTLSCSALAPDSD
jgi:hypothetical protein